MNSLPAVGRVRFYLITSGRVLTAEAAEEDLGYNRAALSPVFHQAHEVIAAVREHSPSWREQGVGPEPRSGRKNG
jgi:hypothetical protein